jgi:hypothetical protein
MAPKAKIIKTTFPSVISAPGKGWLQVESIGIVSESLPGDGCGARLILSTDLPKKQISRLLSSNESVPIA